MGSMRKLSRVVEMVSILIEATVTQIYMCVKTHRLLL